MPVNRFPNKLAPNIPNNLVKNPPFCSFASFWIVSLTQNNPESSINYFYDIFHFFSRDYSNKAGPEHFFKNHTSVADATAVNPNGIKTVLK